MRGDTYLENVFMNRIEVAAAAIDYNHLRYES